jgi:YfiH family protein
MNNKFIEVFPQFEEVTAFFSTKEGAADGYPYNREDVFEENYLDGAMPVWPKQVHKDHIELIEQRPYKPVELAETDGMITNLRGVLLTTVHADCLPVYFFDQFKNAIGLVHAGWRGTDLGIAPKAVQMMMKEFRSYPEDIQVFIGPGISKCCFEVGAEVYEQFKEHWDFIDEFAEAKGEKYYLDLKGINRRQLEEMGIPTENIVASEHCTHCEPDTFCSYRREGGTYKRMGAGICLI